MSANGKDTVDEKNEKILKSYATTDEKKANSMGQKLMVRLRLLEQQWIWNCHTPKISRSIGCKKCEGIVLQDGKRESVV